jgi:hypothetical protein
MNNNSYIGPDELIYNNDGEIHSGGFSVNSIMLKNGLSPIMTLNNNDNNGNTNPMQTGGEKVSDLFNNLVIPNWSLSYNYKNGIVYEGGSNGLYNSSNKNNNNDNDHDDIMEEDLHEKLLNLVKVDTSEIKQHSSNKKTSKKNFKNIIKTKKNVTKKQLKIRNVK